MLFKNIGFEIFRILEDNVDKDSMANCPNRKHVGN